MPQSASSYRLLALAIAALTLLSCPVASHSWNEQISLIGADGKFVANGYPRGYKARTDPGYDGNSMMYLIPTAETKRIHIDKTDQLCHPSQKTQTQTPGYPRLTVAPGSQIAMKNLENGHVTLTATQPGKQKKGGTVLIFGTSSPKIDEKLMDVLQWTADGTGGDKRGKLIQTQNFDDDRCHQINSGPASIERQQQFPDPTDGQPGTKNELWCHSNAMIPKDAPIGKLYTLYWVWQWPTMPGGDPAFPQGKDEYYTTCSDYDVQSKAKEDGRDKNILKQQDPMPVPVANYKSRTALVPQVYIRGVLGVNDKSAPPPGAPQQPSPPANPGTSIKQDAAAAPSNPSTMLTNTRAAAPIASGAALTPLPLADFKPATTAAAPPTGSPLPEEMFIPSSTASAKEMVVTVPADMPVFAFDEGKIVTLNKQKRAAVASDTAPLSPKATHTSEDVNEYLRSHRHGGSAKFRGFYE